MYHCYDVSENDLSKRALEETSGVLYSHPRPSEGLSFWAKSDLAQARRPRLGENSQSAHCTTTTLAQARMPSLSEAVAVAWAKAHSLSENCAGLIMFSLIYPWIGYMSWICMVTWSICTKIGMFGMSYGMELLVGGVITWELGVWDKSGDYGMRNMNLVCDRRNSMSLVGRTHGGV